MTVVAKNAKNIFFWMQKMHSSTAKQKLRKLGTRYVSTWDNCGSSPDGRYSHTHERQEGDLKRARVTKLSCT